MYEVVKKLLGGIDLNLGMTPKAVVVPNMIPAVPEGSPYFGQMFGAAEQAKASRTAHAYADGLKDTDSLTEFEIRKRRLPQRNRLFAKRRAKGARIGRAPAVVQDVLKRTYEPYREVHLQLIEEPQLHAAFQLQQPYKPRNPLEGVSFDLEKNDG